MTYSKRAVLIKSKVDEPTFDFVCDTLAHAPLGMPIAELIEKTNLPVETVRAVIRATLHASWVDVSTHVLVKDKTKPNNGAHPRPVYRFTDKGFRLFHRLPFDTRRI